MKKLIILLLLFFIFTNLKADEEGKLEIGIWVINGQTFPITFTLQAQGIIWDEDHEITTEYSSPSEEVYSNNTPEYTYGWAACWEDLLEYEEYARTIYKLYNDESNAFIYLDLRDCDYPNYILGYSADFFFKYDVTSDVYYYRGAGGETYTELENEELITVWKINHDNDPPSTDCFEDYWINCLALIENNNNPRLAWGPHPTFTTTNFKVYRAVTDQPRNPLSLTFNLIHTTADDETFDYTDLDVNLGSSSDYIYYYVKAHNNGSYSGRTNYVSTYGEYAPQKPVVYPGTINLNSTILEFKLYKNYPNPFNPFTNISFDLPEESFVNLTVYNLFGQTVATLINNNLEAGSFNIQFDAKNLPSGFYFYKIKTGSFSQIKRMLLIK